MLYLNRLKDYRIYKNNIYDFNPTEGSKIKGTLIFLAGNNQEESLNLMKSPQINTRQIKRFYAPQRVTVTLGTTDRKLKVNRNDLFKRVKAETNVSKLIYNIDTLKGNNNMYSDLSLFIETFFNTNTSSYKLKMEGFEKDIKNLLNVKNFSQKIMIIPYNLKSDNLKEHLREMRINSMLEFIYQLAYRFPDKLKMFEGITCLVIDDKSKRVIKFKPETLNKKMLNNFTTSLSIMNKLHREEELTEEEQIYDDSTSLYSNVSDEKVETISDKIFDNIMKNFDNTGATVVQSFTGETTDTEEALEGEIEKISSSDVKKSKKEIENEINNNEVIKQYAEDLKEEKIIQAKNNRNLLRNKMLREEQGKVKINGDKTLDEILNETKELKIEHKEIKVDTTFDTLKVSTLKDFEKNYNEKLYDKDMINAVKCFSNESMPIPMYIRKLEKEDSSDSFTKKETWTIEFEDERRVRHKIKLDVPKIMDDYYLYINGNKKTILKQFCPLPVIKTGPDTVQVVTNYNKIFITRFGSKLSPKIERFKKFMAKLTTNKISVVPGDNSQANREYVTTLEYDEIGSSIYEINIGGDKEIIFNQNRLRERMSDMGVDPDSIPLEKLPIGLEGKKVIYLDVKKEKIDGTDIGLVEYIEGEIIKTDPKLETVLDEIKVGKSFMFTRASAANRDIPLVILLAYKDGLSAVLKKANIKYEFSDKRRKLSSEEKINKGVIQFNDGYLIYDKDPIANSLLLNAMEKVPTSNYSFSDFDEKEAYLDVFQMLYNSRAIGKAFDNICHLLIDPLTEEVLKDLKLPTDFTELFIYANSLLSDSQLTPENHMSNYRFRSNEQIPANVYKVLADAYGQYVNAAANGSNMKFTIPQDKLMKEIVMSQNVEDYSTLNPILEVEKLNNITFKGERAGLNMEQAFTLTKRAYNPSMNGLMGISAPNNNKVGVTRFLSYNPRITSSRGYIEINENPKDLNAGNMLTTSELITTFSSNHDDPPRTAMTTVDFAVFKPF